MKPISENKRRQVISLLDQGLPHRQIVTQANVSLGTISSLCNQHSPGKAKPKGGRPVKLTEATKRLARRMILSGKVDTATKVAKKLKEDNIATVHAKTIRRTLRSQGLVAVTKKKKPRLTARHWQLRLEFANKYKDWTLEDWKQVVWSDETKINRLGSDGRSWAWKPKGSGITDRLIQPTLKFGGGSLMLWGCMTYQGVGFAARIEGRMDSELYISILEEDYLNSLDFYKLDRSKVIFQQDNDPKHTSHLTKNWLADNNIEVLDWPPQSPDLNLIKHLGFELKRRLNDYPTDPSSIGKLWDRVAATWNAIPVQTCTNLIDSMPRRVEAVLKARGGYTKY